LEQTTFFPERDPDRTGNSPDLPSLIRFGTSTWAYPGWQGIVYSKKHTTSEDYLREYVNHPHFRTAGADFTFYRPPDPGMLGSLKSFLPPDFKLVFKVWDEITVDRFQKVDESQHHNRKAGEKNPAFLDAAYFQDHFLFPFQEAAFRDHTGCLLFEFRSSTARQPGRFLERLNKFLAALPTDYNYAVEVREPKLLTEDYVSVLRDNKASHVYNHWDRMPSLAEQMSAVPFTGKIAVSRILTPLGMPYATAKKKFAPYNTLRPENVLPKMREDVVSLCLESVRQRLPGFILVNNRSEGCSPLTIRALEEMLQSRLRAD